MKEYIYSLCLIKGDPFYVGRTNDMARRIGEHTRNAAAGHTETKYQVIRDIVAGGDAWEMVLLAEVDETDEHYEDYWVYLLLCEGYPLANMKAGDARQAAQQNAMTRMRDAGARYSDPKSFLDAREREVKEAAARAATARLQAKAARQENKVEQRSPGETMFAWETPKTFGKRIESPGLRAMRERKAQGHVHVHSATRNEVTAAKEWRDICIEEESKHF